MLKRFRPDDPAFLDQLESRLNAALRQADGRGLLSVTLATPELALDGFPPFRPESGERLFYWSRPSSALLGLGVAAEAEGSGGSRWAEPALALARWRGDWSHVDVDDSGLQPVMLGGFAFAPEGGPDFPAARLFVPALLLRRAGDGCALTFTFPATDGGAAAEAIQRLRRLAAALARQPARGGAMFPRREISAPEDAAWLERVADAVADIQSGSLDKVVLTRRVAVSAERDFDPAGVMAGLARISPRGTHFCLDAPDGGLFLGASPEMLAGLSQGEVWCDALAGTTWTQGARLDDMKNGREHRLVVQAIAETLRPLCSRLEVPAAPVTLHLGHLHHLWSGLKGRVKAGVGLFDLLARLHPTPAVGGYPRQAALDWLARREEKRGAWYTGAIGWMDAAGEGEFAVALRCALVRGRHAELYAGAGIVAGSDPRGELAETEAKLAVMLEALAHG